MAEQNPHFKRILDQIRDKLRAENIKLWLPPYTVSNDLPGIYPEVNILVKVRYYRLRLTRFSFKSVHLYYHWIDISGVAYFSLQKYVRNR